MQEVISGELKTSSTTGRAATSTRNYILRYCSPRLGWTDTAAKRLKPQYYWELADELGELARGTLCELVQNAVMSMMLIAEYSFTQLSERSTPSRGCHH